MRRKFLGKIVSFGIAMAMIMSPFGTTITLAAEAQDEEIVLEEDSSTCIDEPILLDDIEVPKVDMSIIREDVDLDIEDSDIEELEESEEEESGSGITAGTVSNYLLAAEDYHLYSIPLSAGMYLQAQLTTPNDANIDYDLYLMDSDGNILVGSDYVTHINGTAGTLPEAIGYLATGNEATYYVAVLSSVGGSANEAYTLDYSISTNYDSLEIDESVRQARPFTFNTNGGSITSRNLSSPIDNDWYVINIPESRNYNKISLSLSTNSSNTCKYEIYQNVSSDWYEMSLVGTSGSVNVSTGTYYVRVSNALSMEDYDDLDIQNYSLTITPVMTANRIEMTYLSGTEGHKYVTYSGYGNCFRTSTGTVTVTGYAFADDSTTGTSVPVANASITVAYYNPYWDANNTPDWAYVFANGTTDSTGKFQINISLPQATGSEMADSGVSYHYFDKCLLQAFLTENASVNDYEFIFHFAYSVYHSF